MEKVLPHYIRKQLLQIYEYVVDRLSDFYTADETRLWLHAKHPLLNHERAIDLITAGNTEEVLAVIDRLDSGAYI